MNNDVTIILNEEVLGKNFKAYRTVREPLFLAKEVAELIISNPDIAIEMLKKIKRERAKVERLKLKLEEQKPYVAIAKSIGEGRLLITVKEFTILLQKYGVAIGERNLVKWFKDNGFLLKKGKLDQNTPTQRSIKMELFKVIEGVEENEDGRIALKREAIITGKGQLYFMDKLLEEYR